ncbi:MAG: hypothetical protein ACLR9W_02675 [Enterobacter hormaechei]
MTGSDNVIIGNDQQTLPIRLSPRWLYKVSICTAPPACSAVGQCRWQS